MKNRKANLILGLVWWVSFVSMPGFPSTKDPMLHYAQVFEQELAGDVAGALSEYRKMAFPLVPANPTLEERILYRVGVCERRLGRPEEARRVWRRLVESYPVQDPLVLRTRRELQSLERELDRMIVEGHVGAARSFVMAGEWGDEPAMLADTNGAFRVERKVAGITETGAGYCLIFVEHPTQPRVAAVVAQRRVSSVESGTQGAKSPGPAATNGAVRSDILQAGDIGLMPALALSGRVVDTQGRPVSGARIQVVGYKSDIPMPFDRLLPPISSGSNGLFVATGLVPGLRYVITAGIPGFRMLKASETDTVPSGSQGGETSLNAGSIVLQRLGEISLSGRVVDDSGAPVQGDVAAWLLPPVEREVARVKTDLDGRFVFRDLHENGIMIKVECEECLPRSITGLKPMGQEIDVVVKRTGGTPRPEVREPKGVSRAPVRGTPEASEEYDVSVSRLAPSLESLRWLRGNPESGAAFRGDELKGRVLVFHFGSAYRESALRARYPGQVGNMTQILRLYGESGVLCIWILPDEEAKGEAAGMALDLYPDLAIATGGGSCFLPSMTGGNIVVGRDGKVKSVCSDQQLFKAVKAAVTARL